MSRFQRIRDVAFGILMLLFALILFLFPEDSLVIVAAIISFLLLIFGFRQLWFYFTMARHMAGGKMILIQAIIILDLGLFTSSMLSMERYIILFYLLGVFVFTGFVDIMRSLESKRVGASSWKLKLVSGIISVALALLMLVLGIIFERVEILSFGYGISLVYSGVMRIVTAFRKSAVIYIQ